MSNAEKILVIGELDQKGNYTSLTGELLGGARQLADEWGGSVDMLVLASGNPVGDNLCRGAERVFVVANPNVTILDTDAITTLAAELCKKNNPALCLIGQTDLGRDLAPRLAARLDAGLCMDCTEVKYEKDKNCFVQTRPVYGGKALAVFASSPGMLQIDTIRPKSLPPLDSQEKRTGEIVRLPDDAIKIQGNVKLINCEKSQEEGIRLEDAKIIVAGGGGLGDAKGFELLGELAQVLNAAVGATRVPVDEKWVPHHMEIGQTGKIVSPDIYIAVGISGATQHITGILGSGKIIAINKDPDANIFRVADFGLVADYKEALPVLVEKLKGKAA
jgi:electron transfer flavoprotein alpha subunit